MTNIVLEWRRNDNGKKIIAAQDIKQCIEINEDNKEVKNTKAFFREVIYQSYLNSWDKRIVLSDNPDLEIAEVKDILNGLIVLCNSELETIKVDSVSEEEEE